MHTVDAVIRYLDDFAPPELAAEWERASRADCHRMTLTDSRFVRLVEAWPSLPD